MGSSRALLRVVSARSSPAICCEQGHPRSCGAPAGPPANLAEPPVHGIEVIVEQVDLSDVAAVSNCISGSASGTLRFDT